MSYGDNVMTDSKTAPASALTEANIAAFAAAWYQALDFHVPTEEICKLVALDGLQMIFPEKTLHGLGDFKAWYAGGTYTDGEQAPGVINIFFDENHNVVSVNARIEGESARVRVVVAWQASVFNPPAAKSKRVSADFAQDWILVPSARNPYGMEITSYNAVAEPPVFAPGFARL